MAKHIPKHFIQELVARCDIVDLINTRLTLKKRGVNFIACCPFHNEKTPSFTVSQTKQIYHCFGCGVTGNAIGFLMAYERVEFIEAIEILAHQCGATIPYENTQENHSVHEENKLDLYQLLDRAKNYYQRLLGENTAALTYLQNRGLSKETIEKFGLGFSLASWDGLYRQVANKPELVASLVQAGMLIKKDDGGYYDRFRDRIMFPIYDNRGRIIAFGGRTLIEKEKEPKYLNSPETPLFHKGKELYGLYQARQTPSNLTSMIIVEGYMDLLTLVQAGVSNVVATLGTAVTEQHFSLLLRYSKEFIFCFDGDTAGKKAAWRGLETLLPLLQDGIQARFAFLPDGEDPDTFLQKNGRDNFLNFLQSAQPLSDFLFSHLSEQTNTNSIDGRAKLAELAKPLLQKLPPGVYSQMMQQRLAAILRIDVAKLGLQKITAPKTTKTTATPKTTEKLTPLRIAIILLIQQPHLINELSDPTIFDELNIPNRVFLTELLAALREKPEMTSGALLEHFRATEHFATLNKLLHYTLPTPESGVKAEFIGAIQRLNKTVQEQKIENLLSKANQTGLSQEEKLYLRTLLEQKSDI